MNGNCSIKIALKKLQNKFFEIVKVFNGRFEKLRPKIVEINFELITIKIL